MSKAQTEVLSTAPLAATALRLSLGAMWLSHGLWKAFWLGMPALDGFLESQGLPKIMALPLTAAEIGGGVLILLGIHGRVVSLALLPILLGALKIHLPNGLIFSYPNGGFEYPLFLIFASAAHALIGDGVWALRPGWPNWLRLQRTTLA